VTISYDPNGRRAPSGASTGAFSGKVRAAKAGCKRGRTIKLFRFGSLKKTGRSKRKGTWRIFFPNAHGRFYAKAIRKVFVDRTGTTIVCSSDKSPPIRVKS
jgi:hypothetical protein